MDGTSAGATVLAGLPIVAVLVLMVGVRWPAARAGLAGVALTLAVALGGFGYGRTVLGDVGVPGALGGALAEAVWVAATILAIVVPALAIHHLQVRTGGTDVLRLALGRLSDDPRVVALLVGWFFALFMEGAAGFGASVALAAPFLVSAGFRRVEAVTIAMVGHAVGVSFGAVGTPVLPQIAATGFTGLELSRAAGVYHALLGWLPLAVLAWMASRGGLRSPAGRVRVWGWTALAGALFLGPAFLLSRYVGPELPTLGGALGGGLLFVAALRAAGRDRLRLPAEATGGPAASDRTGQRQPAAGQDAVAPGDARSVLRAAAPYLVLVAIVLVTRLVAPVGEALRAVEIGWTLPGGFAGSVQPLYHPGAALLGGLAGGALVQRVARADLRHALARTAGQLGPVTVALLAMLGLSRLMVHSGMTGVLAEAAAGGLGGAWPLAAPLVGALGTFVTGSATASNILFTDFQAVTAGTLGLDPLPLLGAQNFGAAVGNIVCPHNVVAASATVALAGREGDVLRRTLPVCLAYAALGGLLALALQA